MKKNFIYRLFVLLAFLFAASVACQKEEPDFKEDVEQEEEVEEEVPGPSEETPSSEGITNVKNSYADKEVSYFGATISIKFDAAAAWVAELVLESDPEGEWASISSNTQSGDKKDGSKVTIVFEENKTAENRVAHLWVTAEGFEKQCIATLTQAASGVSSDSKLNTAINTYMHDILKEDYLFNEAYNALTHDLAVGYNDFLSTHLLALGDVNEEDGGYYRSHQANAGERFIYSNIVEVQVGTKAIQTGGLGFGPFMSTALSADSNEMGIAVSYVRRGSPAEAAGLRRGDIIYMVNGVPLTKDKTAGYYYDHMMSLYQNPSGSYVFTFLRFEDNGNGGYDLFTYESGTATAGYHIYDPVLHASVMSYPDDPSIKIGYLVYESFDLNSQEFLEDAISGFVEAGITDLILDLRFNAGGAVAQSRWLSGCIAGPANGSSTFTKVVYNNGKTENWTFDYGYSNDTDNLGKPIYLGLNRVYVIASYNTASAAELVINSLRGIDFPVKVIGCRTEGKNVGMTVSETTYNGRRFQFSPVTFWVRNAKDFGSYRNGLEPDEYVNNENTLMNDDADNVFPYSFSDWGNMDYNIALQWAYCDITGKPRWTHTPTKASGEPVLLPMDFQQMAADHLHWGNLIYSNNN